MALFKHLLKEISEKFEALKSFIFVAFRHQLLHLHKRFRQRKSVPKTKL